jgi:hypothetical protein
VGAGVSCKEMGDDRAGVFLGRVGHICGCYEEYSEMYLQHYLRAAACTLYLP